MSLAYELSAVSTLPSVTNALEGWACRSQRLVLPGGERTWTVLGRDHVPVGPAEEYLEYLRVQRVSPNTVKSYARALALWWEYLEQFGLGWDAVTLEAVGGFLTWLRTGEGPQVVSLEAGPARFAEPTIAVRLRAVLSCYTYHQLNGVDVGGEGRGAVSDHARTGWQLQAAAGAHRPPQGPAPGGDPGPSVTAGSAADAHAGADRPDLRRLRELGWPGPGMAGISP